MSNDIEISDLTSFDIAFDGSKARLGMLDKAGEETSLHLPYELLTSLVMTLPTIQSQALRAQSGDRSARLVFPTSAWSLERAEEAGKLILRLATLEGFEVCFVVTDDDIISMAGSLDNQGTPVDTGRELH